MSFIRSCGLMLEPQLGMAPKDVVAWARYAEKAGFGYIFRSDHLIPTTRERGLDSPECWATLGMMAANTRRVKFGPLVSPVGFRNPALLAKMACTVHSFSGGRLILGVGAGWFEDEYLAHGYEFPKFRIRRQQFEEALKIIRPLTEGKPVNFRGTHFSAKTDCYPKPRGKVRLIIGGRNQKIVATAARYADEWNIFSSPVDQFLKLKEMLSSKTSRKVAMSLMGYSILAENKRDLEKRMRHYARMVRIAGGQQEVLNRIRAKGVICGDVENFVAEVNKRRDVGIQRFYFQVLDPRDKGMFDLLADTLKNSF
ncbi:MAG: LLM class flavin-dependent oxidoreductase [Thaumarchaeota archaeon]|nr:LLM class flavin-dependent oxidoreductase [Nitrososphaerota archaeon]